MQSATDKESVASFTQSVLAGTGWEVTGVRRRGERLEPPDSYWSLFEIDIKKEEEQRQLRLVAKGALSPAAWETLRARLERHGAGLPCDPINGIGYPVLFPDSMHAYWFYPYDPTMPNLPLAHDAEHMGGVLVGRGESPGAALPGTRISIERVRYVPEVGAILRYSFDDLNLPVAIYGKVQPGHRGLRTFRVVEQLWKAAARYPGYLRLPRPLAYVEELGMLIEEGVRGRAVSNRRTSMEFMLMPVAAADALAVIHESGVASDEQIRIEEELARLDRVKEQFAYVLPAGHFLLRDLVAHMRDYVRRTPEEDWLPTHGDLKYDQFFFHNDEFTLLDFDYFAIAETSYDLGKFCAYLVPSHPRDWEDTVVVEEARSSFIRRYRELRPHATLQRFAVYEALQLALRAMSFMWAQVPDWERIAEIYLVMAYERLKSRLPE